MEEFVPVVAILAVFGTITAIVFGPVYMKSRERHDVQQTVRHALDKGQALPPELIDAMTKEVEKNLPSRTRDIRRGIVWLAVGVGLAAFSLVSNFGGDWDGNNVDSGFLGLACIPATMGLAYIVLSFFNKNKD